jgi:hypothetical protein
VLLKRPLWSMSSSNMLPGRASAKLQIIATCAQIELLVDKVARV